MCYVYKLVESHTMVFSRCKFLHCHFHVFQKLKDVATHFKQYNLKMFSTIQILLLIVSIFPLILHCRLILAPLKLYLSLVIGYTL